MSKIVSSLVAGGLVLAAAAPASAANLFTLTVNTGFAYETTVSDTLAQKTAKGLDNPVWTLTNSATDLGANTIITSLVITLLPTSGTPAANYWFDYGGAVSPTAPVANLARTFSDQSNNTSGSKTFTVTFGTTPTANTTANSFSIGETLTFRTEFDKNTTAGVPAAANTDYRQVLNGSTATVTFKLGDGTSLSRSVVLSDLNPTSSEAFSFSAQLAADVPEPASWAMMIGGFGMIGASLRRRRSLSVRFA